MTRKQEPGSTDTGDHAPSDNPRLLLLDPGRLLGSGHEAELATRSTPLSLSHILPQLSTACCIPCELRQSRR